MRRMETRENPSLLGVPKMRIEDGPSLRMGGQLRRREKLQVFLTIFGLHVYRDNFRRDMFTERFRTVF